MIKPVAWWAQIKSGRRNQARPGARMVGMVTTELRPVRMEEKPVRKIPSAVRMT